MTSAEIRKRYLQFFSERGHAVVSSASLVPEGDTTTLFTGSGMQPLVKFLLGEPHPLGKRIANSQACFRTEDIEEVGDNRHTTLFEMLGNWSFGDYFKEEQLRWFFEFLTETVGLDPARIYVTVFAGDEANGIPRDEESVRVWKRLFAEKGIKEAKDAELLTVERGSEMGMHKGERIFYYDATKNWWSRTGAPSTMPPREPGGPDSEVFYEFTQAPHDPKYGAHCHPNCDCGRFMEIGNSVFMEYRKTEAGMFEKLPQRNVDFGGGLERITAAANDDPDIFHIDAFSAMTEGLASLGVDLRDGDRPRRKRIILDHIRASVYLIAEGVEPSNKDRGYILRRLLRRAIYHAASLAGEAAAIPLSERTPLSWNERAQLAVRGAIEAVISTSPEERRATLIKCRDLVFAALDSEQGDFIKLLKSNAELQKLLREMSMRGSKIIEITGDTLFTLHSTYGIPIDYILDEARRHGCIVSESALQVFEERRRAHQEVSRAGLERKFGGHGLLLDTGELKARDEKEVKVVTRLHTATHLLQAALREVLGPEVRQTGSDITAERTRFDFTFPRKLTPEEIKKVEDLVSEKIKEDLSVAFVELPIEEAKQTGALYFFKAKYGDRVKVYYVGPTLDAAWSKEFCGGPHVSRTGEVGNFRIAKEEAVAAGVRRIRGVLA